MKHTSLKWKSDYELGIQDIDLQHHYFLDLINRLSKQLGESDDLAYQDRLINELNAYARFHFISEENIMYKAGYPELQAHKRHHQQLLDRLSAKGAVLQLRLSEQNTQDIIDFLVDWFLNHTNAEDRLFADFLHRKRRADGPD